MFIKTQAVPALQIGGAYVADDCVGALLTFPINTTGFSGRAVIKRLMIVDADVEDAELFLHLFTASPAAAARTDEDECVQVAADLAIRIISYHIEAADYVDFAGDSFASYELDTAILFDGSNIYGVLQCVATPTYTAVDDLTVRMVVEQR